MTEETTDTWGRAPADDDARRAALEGAVYGQAERSVATVAQRLGWSSLAVAQAVGEHPWMYLAGDLRSVETARVDYVGK